MKRFYTHQKAPKAKKHKKITKQKHKNVNKRTKKSIRLKNFQGGKSHYSLIRVFALAKKKIEESTMEMLV